MHTRLNRIRVGVAGAVLAASCWLGAGPAPAQGKKGEVRAFSPPWVEVGKTSTVQVVGQDLSAEEIRFSDSRVQGRVVKVGPSAPKNDEEKKRGNTVVEVEVTVPAGLKAGAYPFQLLPESGEPTPGTLILDVPAPEVAEKEPNNELRKPMELPEGSVTITGKLDNEGVDVFRVMGKKGETWRFELFSRRLDANAKLEGILRVRDPRLAPVKAAVDQGRDCAIEYTLPMDGPYLLELFDGDNRAEGGFTYRLHIRRL